VDRSIIDGWIIRTRNDGLNEWSGGGLTDEINRWTDVRITLGVFCLLACSHLLSAFRTDGKSITQGMDGWSVVDVYKIAMEGGKGWMDG